jgi:hypothetical protein
MHYTQFKAMLKIRKLNKVAARIRIKTATRSGDAQRIRATHQSFAIAEIELNNFRAITLADMRKAAQCLS